MQIVQSGGLAGQDMHTAACTRRLGTAHGGSGLIGLLDIVVDIAAIRPQPLDQLSALHPNRGLSMAEEKVPVCRPDRLGLGLRLGPVEDPLRLGWVVHRLRGRPHPLTHRAQPTGQNTV